MTVWGDYGNVGNGKDTKLAQIVDAWAHYLRTQDGVKLETSPPIYGNADFHNDELTKDLGRTFEPYHRITCDQFLNLDAHKDLQKAGVPEDDFKTRALVVIQEPHAWGIDSRTGGSALTRAMAVKGTQSRHFRLDIDYTTQIPSEIDKRFRHLCKVTTLALEPIEDNKGDILRFRYAYFGRYQHKMIGIDRPEAKRLWTLFDSEQHIETEFTDEYLDMLEGKDMIERPETEFNRKRPAERKFVVDETGTRVYEN